VSWPAGSALVVSIAALGGVLWYEHRRPPAKLVALVAALAGLAVAARVLFAAVPNVQGTTDVALLSGYVLGPAPGFMVGALGALASNFFLGQGPWTPWQMVGWGTAGLGGAALAAVARRALGRWSLALACGLAGLAFGAWMDLFTLTSFAAETSTDGYIAIATLSLPFNVAHAIGNFALCLVFGPAFVRVLERFRRRLHVRWVPVGAGRLGVGTTASLLVLTIVLAIVPAAGAATQSVRDGVRYLERAQNADGGFGAGPREGSSQLITGWAVLGLEAAGRHPLDVRAGARTPIDFIRAGARSLTETGELERTILAVCGAGFDARRFGGRDLLADLERKRRPDGSFSGLSNWTAFGIAALRGCGRSPRSAPIRRAASWLARQQNDDGGFSYAQRGGASFVDETGAALQGLGAGGRTRGAAVEGALRYLRRAQNPDGGFGQSQGARSNAQSTAWAVQGIVAAGRAPASFKRGRRSALGYLTTLQQDDGSFRYSRSSAQTPVWVTAQVIAALRRKAFPVQEPPRRRTKKTSEPEPRAKAATAVRRERGRRAQRKPQARGRPKRDTSQTVTARPAATQQGESEGDGGGVPLPALAGGCALLAASVGAFAVRRRVGRG
jgi:energy-coupling factor transport system substrate-specific component